jgi:DNA-binding XRE family transcriptional regulator
MSTLSFWWHIYGQFSPKERKRIYPHPGEVVKHYREQVGGMERKTLASLLGVSASEVCRMEEECVGLDSIARCRQLITTLHIPACLLGLDSWPHAKEGTHLWWTEEGYPPFEAGEDGYPLIGQVLKHYRRQKLEHGQRTKGRSIDLEEEQWTQYGLALALGVSEFTVRKMENNHEGLDSITRRQALAFFLDVPPILLGLDSQPHEAPAKQDSPSIICSSTQKSIILAKDVFYKYRKKQENLWTEYFTSHGKDVVGKALREIKHFQDLVPLTKGEQQQKVIELQSLSHQFIAAVALEVKDFNALFYYENLAVDFAREIQNNGLTAAALLRRSMAEYGGENLAFALRDIDEATDLLEGLPTHLSGTVLQNAGMLHAHLLQDESDVKATLSLLDQAGAIARNGNFGEDTYFLKFNVGMYHIRRAIALIAIGRQFKRLRKEKLNEALSELELAKKCTLPEMTRRHALIHLFRAQAHYGLGEYAASVKETLLALPVFQRIHSDINIGYIVDLYVELQTSPYKQAPLTLRLQWELRQLGLLPKETF